MEATWETDIADGVLKNHTLSAKLREAAIAQTKFMQFVDTEPGYGRQKGDSVTVRRIRNISEPTSASLGERDRIPIDTFAESSVTITVNELGRGVEYTHKLQLLNAYDPEDKIQRKLRQQLSLVLDPSAAAAFKTAKIVYIPTSLSGGEFDTDGTPSTAALQNLTVAHVKVIRDYMSDSIHVPGYNAGEQYICLASTKALRGLKNDPEWMAWRQYAQPEQAFFVGEVGMIENIKLIEVNHTNALSGSKGTGSVLGEALFFGDDGVTMAVAEDPELRAAIPGDFGRQKAVAWYGVLAFGLVWDTANDGEARVIRVTSS